MLRCLNHSKFLKKSIESQLIIGANIYIYKCRYSRNGANIMKKKERKGASLRSLLNLLYVKITPEWNSFLVSAVDHILHKMSSLSRCLKYGSVVMSINKDWERSWLEHIQNWFENDMPKEASHYWVLLLNVGNETD